MLTVSTKASISLNLGTLEHFYLDQGKKAKMSTISIFEQSYWGIKLRKNTISIWYMIL